MYYLKLSLIVLIYYVTFTNLVLEKGFMKVENVRILRCFTNENDFLFIKVAYFNNSVDFKMLYLSAKVA